jgi:GntR family transcriptional regulator
LTLRAAADSLAVARATVRPATETAMTHEQILRDYLARSQVASPFKMQKYVRAAQVMQRMIEDGHWTPGDRIPPEAEMVGILEMSLGTVQKALGILAETGQITREHGRGTFVAGGKVPEEDVLYFRFLADDRTSLLPVFSRVVELGVTEETGPWSDFLVDSRRFVRIRRFMSVNHEFDIYSEVYFSAERFGEVATYPPRSLDGALIYRLLAERFNAPTHRVAQHMGCGRLPDTACRALGLGLGAIGITWKLLSYWLRDAPLSFQHAFVPPNDRMLLASDMTVSRYQAMAPGAVET